MAVFKANCIRLLREVEANGEPLTVTVRGKPIAIIQPPDDGDGARSRRSAFGMLRTDRYRFDCGPETPGAEQEEWDVMR